MTVSGTKNIKIFLRDKKYLKCHGYRSDDNAVDKGICFFYNNILRKHSELQMKVISY